LRKCSTESEIFFVNRGTSQTGGKCIIASGALAETWRRLWGDGNFRMTFLRKTISILSPTISDNLFSDSICLKSDIYNRPIGAYMTPLFLTKNLNFRQKYSYLDACAVPTSNFGGTVTPVPLSLRLCSEGMDAPDGIYKQNN